MLDEKKLVDLVNDQLKKGDKKPYELQAYLNIAYFAGKQWVALDRTNNKLFEPPKESWQIRFTANRIQPIIRTELAKISKNKFVMMVGPATNENSDIKAARTGEKVIEWLEYELELQQKDQELGLWGLTTGISFMHPYWNPGKGESLMDPDNGDTVNQGDVDCEVINLFDLKWDMSVNKFTDSQWNCLERVRTTDYVKKMYGKDVKAEDNIITSNIFDAQLKDLNTLGSGVTYKPAKGSVKVKEYWELPSTEYPKGRRITVANETLLFYDEDIGFGDNDNSERELPFFPFVHITVPGRSMPTCVAEQLLPINREYNKSRSQIIENKNLMSNPIWLVPKTCLEEDISNMPGGVYEYNPGVGKPEIVIPPMIGADVYKNLEMCIEEFDYISGQHETSHGETPTGVKSGVAIQFLQEQDDTKLGPTISNYIRCKQKYMRYMLKMIQKKYDIPRTLRLVGSNRKAETIDFQGSDLTSIDVRVQESSMYQMSKAAKQDWIMQLIQNGVLNPQTDRGLIIKMLELGITDDLYDTNEIDSNQAQNEQDSWKQGDFNTTTRDFYNHDVHINEHNKFRKSNDYTDLKPEAQQTIDAHVQEHLNFVAQKMMAGMGTPNVDSNANIDVNAAVSQLSPDEQAYLKNNPNIIDKAVSNTQ